MAPWDLEQQSYTWVLTAEAAQAAEASARKAAEQRSPTRRGASRHR